MAESEDFFYNAPQTYFDLNGQEPPEAGGDSFFEVHHEITPQNEDSSQIFQERSPNNDSSLEFYSTAQTSISQSTLFHCGKLRRSLSVGHIDLTNLNEKNRDKSKNIPLKSNSRPHSSRSMRKVPSTDHLNRLAEPKRVLSKENSSSMTLAEQVLKFHIKTPKRFRSKPSPKLKACALNLEATVAQSPKLKTSQRVRPSTAISKEEQELLDMEEAKKFKIRAQPVNKRVLRGPMKVEWDKKFTVVEPFHLTEVSKKSTNVENKVYEFKAQPVPKSLQHPFKVVKTTPSKKASRSNSLNEIRTNESSDKNSKIMSTSNIDLKTLNFEERNKLTLQKREEFIEKYIKEEKESRNKFHAHPLPKNILRMHNGSAHKSHISKNNASDQDVSKFKAKPAAVLTQKPFEVKYYEHRIEIEPFQLSTEDRLEARQMFDKHIKEKELLCEKFRKEHEELERKLNEEAVIKLRKEMEHKAQPIRKYKQLPTVAPSKITVPISPNFHRNDIKNKENIE